MTVRGTRVFVFVPARVTSSRLPAKALRPLAGKPALRHLLERLKLSRMPAGVVLCTTHDAADDPLVDLAKETGVHWYRGSVDDLLDRYWQAARSFGVDVIVNVDGDDIFVDPEQVDEIISHYERTGADFITYSGLPFGAAPIVVSSSALETVCRFKRGTNTATGWARYFERPDLFHIERIEVRDPRLRHPGIRLTLDYPEDLQMFDAIYSALYRSSPLRLRDVLGFLEQHPEIVAINANLTDQYWSHFEAQCQDL